MELSPIESVALNPVSKALLAEVDETAHKVDDFRPLSADALETVQRELLGERVYSSNAIEGNTCDLRETREILRTGHIAIAKKREATEVVNLGKAIEYVQRHSGDSTFSSRMDEFLNVHGILLDGIDDGEKGRFRDHDVVITGAQHQPPDHRYVLGMVERFFDRLRDVKDVHRLVLAAWSHWTIARIHPFHDGNGRMARLWQDLLLFQGSLTCAIIRPEDRMEYLSALATADDECDFNPLIQLIARRVASTLDKYVYAQQETAALGDWAIELAGEADARADQKRHLSYEAWARKMETLRFAFERCAARITEQSESIEIQVHRLPILDRARWESIRSGVPVSDNWFFRLIFRKDRHDLTYIFFFGRHYWSDDLDTEEDKAQPRACLLISEQSPGDEKAERLDKKTDTPLSLRQVFLAEDGLVRKRFDAARDAELYDRSIEPLTIAQEFIRDVLLSRMV